MTTWSPEQVEVRLAEAADVLSRLPEERLQGFVSTWPEVVRSFWESYGMQEPILKRPWPSPASIDRMEEAMIWVQFLAPEDARLVWARAEGTPWKALCWRFGIARATANRRWRYGLSVIALRLNGHPVPTKRSQSFVVERASRLSRINAR